LYKFDPHQYSPAIAEILADAPRNDLGPGTPCEAVETNLSDLSQTAFQGLEVLDQQMRQACLSGIWLRFDFLDESHSISQEILSPTGSYWHGIMHRREPNASNAKYWFRRVGDHPLFETLGEPAAALAAASDIDLKADWLKNGDWDPFEFVDLCSRHAASGGPPMRLCQELAQLEWCLLFDSCYRQAVAG
jgi:hypothetical protein